MGKQKIHDLESLDREILRLRLHKAAIEKSLDENVGKLKKNYGSMVLNSVFSQFSPASSNIWISLIGRILENDKLRNGMQTLADKVSDKVGDGVQFATQKLFHRK